MLLSMQSTMRTVFTIFAAFWALVIVVLFLGVGALLKRHHRIVEQHRHSGSGH